MAEQQEDMKYQACGTPDLAESKLALLLWGIPLALILWGGFWAEGRVWLWVPALLVAGVACLVNAARCGRLHCYFTGVLYLLGAVATALRGIGLLLIPWGWLAGGLIAGTVLAFVPEWVRGKYVGKHPTNAGQGSTCC